MDAVEPLKPFTEGTETRCPSCGRELDTIRYEEDMERGRSYTGEPCGCQLPLTFSITTTRKLPERMVALPGYPRDAWTGEPVVPEPRKAFADAQHCQLVKDHGTARPVIIEYHHAKPVYMQNHLYGKIVYGPSLWLCGNCHDAVHAWLYWLTGAHREPAGVNRLAKAEALRTFTWYMLECERLGIEP